MSLLFIGCLYSDTQSDEFYKNSKKGYQFAAQVFQESLITGFCNNNVKPTVLTIPSLSSFPFGNRCAIIKDSLFIHKGLKLGNSFGFINIFGLRSIHRRIIDKFAISWYNSSNDSKYVLVYGLHPHLMRIAVDLRSRFNDIKLSVIIPDLPEFMGSNIIYRALRMDIRKAKIVNRLLPFFDKYVVLSAHMMNRIRVIKPFLVIEGIYNEEAIIDSTEKEKTKVIFYSGNLNKRYGIIDLLEAFCKVSYHNCALWLCGAGDSVQIISDYENKDSRIRYLGSIQHDEVLRLQKSAYLLVNPRHSYEEYTRYSFPSKTMEFLASGTATIMCHLDSIPNEYNKYLFYFDDETVDGMSRRLENLLNMDDFAIVEKGKEARSFIISEKNCTKQTAKILSFLKS